jgi:hypothetical protein
MKSSLKTVGGNVKFMHIGRAIAIAVAVFALVGVSGCQETPIAGVPNRPPLDQGNSHMPPPRNAPAGNVLSTASTVGVACNYSNAAQNTSSTLQAASRANWRCDQAQRLLSANGLPDHTVGAFPNTGNPNKISAQIIEAKFTLSPTLTDRAAELGGPRGTIGYVLNGVKIDAGTGGTCNDDGSVCDAGARIGRWSMEALGQSVFKFGIDDNNAHVQPDGSYHYHGIPEGFVASLGKGKAMTLIGWASDGFPIYARYGYSAAKEATSPLKVMTGSYRVKAQPPSNRPSVTNFPMGAFNQDYEYVAGLSDLDECNGRFGVTPEFPQGIYHYYATDTFPYFQRCVRGRL